MKNIVHSISASILKANPGYVRGLVIAKGVNNSGHSSIALELLRNAEASSTKDVNLEAFLASPNIASWREAFRRMGANPSEYRPAHEALGRRAIQGKPLPDINPLVNLGNALSLRYRIPVGVHPLDSVRTAMELRSACGDESFIAFGSDKKETPKVGEVIFADGNEVLSRNWIWRQAKSSITLSSTQHVAMNIDGLPPFSQSMVEEVCAEAERLLREVCGGEIFSCVLSELKPSITIRLP